MKLIHQTFGLVVLYLVPFALFYGPIRHIQTQLGVYQAHAEEYTFDPEIPDVEITLPSDWRLLDGPAYKNERLQYYQSLLRERGIVNIDHLRLFSGQLLAENGAISEEVHGDAGCSVGIPQRNVCQFGYSAKSFLKKFPEWNDWKRQMQWMADYTARSYDRFNKNPKCAIVYHNRPASALNGCQDTHAGYYRTVVSRSLLLSL